MCTAALYHSYTYIQHSQGLSNWNISCYMYTQMKDWLWYPESVKYRSKLLNQWHRCWYPESVKYRSKLLNQRHRCWYPESVKSRSKLLNQRHRCWYPESVKSHSKRLNQRHRCCSHNHIHILRHFTSIRIKLITSNVVRVFRNSQSGVFSPRVSWETKSHCSSSQMNLIL